MQSTASNVTAYFEEVPPERVDDLKRLREACVEILSGYEECMEYGMPSYKKGGKVEVAFASQKQYIALYILKKEVLDAQREKLVGLSIGKGCIRYRRVQQMDFAVIRSLLQATKASSEEGC